MGAYLSKPITRKHVDEGEMGGLVWGSCSMQGWRQNQEDAIKVLAPMPEEPDCSLFAVFDGHGGAEVSQWCADNIHRVLTNLPEWKEKNYAAALEKCFLALDELLLEEGTAKELTELRARLDDEPLESNDEEEDVDAEDAEAIIKAKANELLDSWQSSGSPMSMMQMFLGGGKRKKVKVPEESRSSSSEEERPARKQGKAGEDEREDDTESPEKENKGDDVLPTTRSKSKESNGDHEELDIVEEDESQSSVEEGESAGDEESSEESGDDSIVEEEEKWDTKVPEDMSEEEEEGGAQEVPVMDDDRPGVGSGTTALVCLLVGGTRLIVANAGDCRAVLWRDSQALDLSTDHKPEDLPEKTRILAAGAVVTPDGRINGGLNLSGTR